VSNLVSESSSEPTSSPGEELSTRLGESRTLNLLRTLTQLAEQVAPAVARRASLTHNELRALEHLMDQPLGPGELSRILGVSSAAASGIIDRLEARGHALRESHASDGRRTSVTISATGREEVIGFLMPMFRELAIIDAELDDTERVAVERFLTGAIRALRAVI
jgi:DNA-binding MarR family transcriptional regulator